MTLYRKYRAQKFEELLAQDHISLVLKAQISQNSYSHAYMFTGPRGCGKTSTARIFAKAISCLDNSTGEPCCKCANCISIQEGKALDIIEIDAASNRGIDNIREFRESIEFAPINLPKKVIIIDEVHMLTKEAFNALLKTLEEPPAHAILILATTDIHKVPATILSRCQRFDFRLATIEEISGKLQKIVKEEGKNIDNESITLVAKLAQGSFRDSESILEKLITNISSQDITYAEACKILGLVGETIVREYIEHLNNKDFPSAKKLLKNIESSGFSANQFVGQAIQYIYDNMVDLSAIGILDQLNHAQNEMKYSKNDFLVLEIATYKIITNASGNLHSNTNSSEPNREHTTVNNNNSNVDIESLRRQIFQDLKNEFANMSFSTNANVNDTKNVSDAEFKPKVVDSDVRQVLQDKWLDIIDYSKEINPMMAGNLSQAKIVSYNKELNTVTLFVKFKLHKDTLERKGRELFMQAVYRCTGIENVGLSVQYPGTKVIEEDKIENQETVADDKSKGHGNAMTQEDVVKDLV